MSYLVPRFTFTNYTPIMSAPWTAPGGDRWDLRELIAVLRPKLLKRFALLDARKLGTDLNVPTTEKITIAAQQIKLSDAMVALKLLCPTVRATPYFYRDVGVGTHLGLDILLPQHMPIVSFTAGKVVRIKTRDGVTKNEGNCVVVQDTRGYFRGYEHLETIGTTLHKQVQAGEVIGTCGKTGNATQYHLHLQVDRSTTASHPYRSESLPHILTHTVDPLSALRAVSPVSTLKDLPYEHDTQDAILLLVQAGIVKGSGGHIFPTNTLQRYEMALLTHRMLKTYSRYSKLVKQATTSPAYTDMPAGEPELTDALLRLRQYGLMKGETTKFYPYRELNGESCLAVLGRSFFGLKDTTTAGQPWYKAYVDYFTTNGLIPAGRGYIGKPIPRKEIFLVCKTVLEKKGLVG